MKDYTKISYTREWFQDKENQAHTIQDIKQFEIKDCNNIIQIGEHFLLDLIGVYENGKNRSPTEFNMIGYFDERDVKEFIRRLKEELTERNYVGGKSCPNWIVDKIDKLAGEKLI